MELLFNYLSVISKNKYLLNWINTLFRFGLLARLLWISMVLWIILSLMPIALYSDPNYDFSLVL